MARRVGGLVEVDDTRADVRLQVTLERRGAGRNRRKVACSNKHCRKQMSVIGEVQHGVGEAYTYRSSSAEAAIPRWKWWEWLLEA